MTLLKFSDVSLAFGAMPLLDKVSWQIARGERVCIIGRNGTGKSSMLRPSRASRSLTTAKFGVLGPEDRRIAAGIAGC